MLAFFKIRFSVLSFGYGRQASIFSHQSVVFTHRSQALDIDSTEILTRLRAEQQISISSIQNSGALKVFPGCYRVVPFISIHQCHQCPSTFISREGGDLDLEECYLGNLRLGRCPDEVQFQNLLKAFFR